ncbi:MAG TPA: cysteine desulfurase NifS [bacterium]|nr:cysteine desulfurase NifS [bacterium]
MNVYLDNNATTRVDPQVLEEMLPFFKERYGNPSSIHTFGGREKATVEQARGKVAEMLNADTSEIVFTSCGTESNNTAIRGILDANPDKKHIITTKVEHPATLSTVRFMQRFGYRITELSVDAEGMLDVDELRAAISNDTALITIMWANNETGVVFPVREIAEIAGSRGVPFHTDAVQAAGKIPIDMSDVAVDALSISGHKLNAPKGIGVLYVRKATAMLPYLIGGHQESGRRAGTENVPYIAGLGKAAELARNNVAEENSGVKALRDKLESTILKEIPDTRLNGHKESRLPNTTNISFEFIEGESILLMLDRDGIAASSGSACTSGSLEPSHVLRAMGVPFTAAHGSIRFSLSRFNTEDEIDYVIEKIPPIIAKLREMSPFT